MSLCSTNNDSVGTFFNHSQVKIRIRLLARAETTVAFRVGHGTVDGQVFFLHHQKKLFESFVISCAQLAVHFKSYAIYCIYGVHTNTSLKT